MSELFQVAKPTISEHIKHIYQTDELEKRQLFGNSEQFKQSSCIILTKKLNTIIMLKKYRIN